MTDIPNGSAPPLAGATFWKSLLSDPSAATVHIAKKPGACGVPLTEAISCFPSSEKRTCDAVFVGPAGGVCAPLRASVSVRRRSELAIATGPSFLSIL